MALHNLARMLVTVGGTGPITLGNAASSFNDLATAGVGNGETVTYAIEDLTISGREIGRGSYNTSTKVFTRSTVLASTNSGNPINCTNQAQLFVTVAAEDIAPLPDLVGTNGQLIVGQTGAQSAWKSVSGDLTLSAAGLATIVNITTGATLAGDLVATNIVAPSTPSAGSTAIYVDSTNKVLSSKNDAGAVSNTVVPSTASAHQFATSVSASGVVTYTQPAVGDISGGTALTVSNDTNVTLTAGGSASSALLAAASVTAGWTGTLAVGRGGSGAATFTAGGVLYGNTASAFQVTAAPSSGQILVGNTTTPGFVTMSGDATITNLGALTIAANAVTNAKMATVTNQTIKSNISGGTAVPSDNTLSAILDNILGSSQGDIIYRGASNWTVLAPGTSGNFLQTQGASANPQWAAGGSGVTSVATAGLATGGTITTTGTITVTAAVKSDQTTATSTSVAVVPGVQQNHPSAAKAWVYFTGSTGAILASYNVTSITRNAAGDYTVNFTTAFTSANYSFAGSCGPGTGATTGRFVAGPNGSAPTASAFRFAVVSTTFALADSDFTSANFFGTQ